MKNRFKTQSREGAFGPTRVWEMRDINARVPMTITATAIGVVVDGLLTLSDQDDFSSLQASLEAAWRFHIGMKTQEKL